MKRLFFIGILATLSFIHLNGQEEWVVPKADADKLSPEVFTDSSRNSGSSLFKNNCLSCHGAPGKNAWDRNLSPSPGDPASQKFQSNTDGEMFYKVKKGRTGGLMPGFKGVLSDREIWGVISYIRSFNRFYKQKIARKKIQKAYKGDISISLVPAQENKIKVRVEGSLGNQTEHLKDVEVELSAKRYFGTLPIEEPKFTNAQGEAEFSLPKKLPGDAMGNITLIAQLTNQELYGDFKHEEQLPVGIATKRPSLVAQRAMWNKTRKAPLWILATYFGGVLCVWGTIFYVLYQIKRIYDLG